jgi:hypothetical protein
MLHEEHCQQEAHWAKQYLTMSCDLVTRTISLPVFLREEKVVVVSAGSMHRTR